MGLDVRGTGHGISAVGLDVRGTGLRGILDVGLDVRGTGHSIIDVKLDVRVTGHSIVEVGLDVRGTDLASHIRSGARYQRHWPSRAPSSLQWVAPQCCSSGKGTSAPEELDVRIGQTSEALAREWQTHY